MTLSHKSAKEYLSQAYRIDARIASKIEQVHLLRDRAEKACAALSYTPPNGTRNVHQLEDTICKLANLQGEIKTDLHALVDLKHDIANTIKHVENKDLQLLLELRYLCFKTWPDIALELNCVRRHVHRLHDKALAKINFV